MTRRRLNAKDREKVKTNTDCSCVIGIESYPYDSFDFIYKKDWRPEEKDEDIEYVFFEYCPRCGVKLPKMEC